MNKNLFSYWYPKVEHCGIRTPKSWIIDVPENVQKAFWQYDSGLKETEWNELVDNWLEENVYCLFNNNYSLFNKNGAFSNKFYFKVCVSTKKTVKENLLNIVYTSLLYSTGGNSEIIFREIIPYDYKKTPTIYDGMPLRNEFRVFYDFDTRKVLYSVNYWDYDYCVKNISVNETDRIVFEHEKEKQQRVFLGHKDKVENLVADKMKNVELEGKWSVDILLDEKNEYWLIDMALAENSAYWKGNV